MSCPNCGCKVCYPYYEDDWACDTNEERCSACGYIFDIWDEIEDDDDDFGCLNKS